MTLPALPERLRRLGAQIEAPEPEAVHALGEAVDRAQELGGRVLPAVQEDRAAAVRAQLGEAHAATRLGHFLGGARVLREVHRRHRDRAFVEQDELLERALTVSDHLGLALLGYREDATSRRVGMAKVEHAVLGAVHVLL